MPVVFKPVPCYCFYIESSLCDLKCAGNLSKSQSEGEILWTTFSKAFLMHFWWFLYRNVNNAFIQMKKQPTSSFSLFKTMTTIPTRPNKASCKEKEMNIQYLKEYVIWQMTWKMFSEWWKDNEIKIAFCFVFQWIIPRLHYATIPV